jgi:subtilisin family serine protease
MPLRKIAMGMMGAVMAVAAASAVGPEQHPLRHEVTPGAAQLKAFGGRSAQQVASPSGSKFDPALAQIARHANKLRPGFEMQDLKNLNPGARFHQAPDGTPMVLIEATSRGNPLQLKSTLINMGLQRAAHFSNAVSGWLPVSQLDAVTQQVELHSIRAAMPYTRTGATTTQGDFVMNAPTVRSANSLSGNGVKVGILSDSYDCYATYAANGVPADGHNGYANENGIITTAAGDISTGDIPSNVTVNEESNTNTAKASNTCFDFGTAQLPFSDEGRAMMQIVHDVAPNASLNFYPAIFGQSDFANGVITMANQGAKIIADDVGYFEEPFFQDGVISQAITQVKAAGVAYFTAAGNNGNLAYDNPTNPAAPATTPLSFNSTAAAGQPGAGEKLLNFDATGGGPTTKLHVTVPSMRPGDFLAVVVQWDQPFVTGATGSPGASSQIDVCLLNVMGNDTVGDDNLNPLNSGNCTGANAVGADPLQVILVGNPASSTANSQPAAFDIQIGLANNTAAPKRIKVAVEGDGLLLGMSPFFTGTSPTVQGHSMSADAISVGAALYLNTPACGVTPAVAEVYSSFGGGPILFDTTGTALTAPQVRQKPDLVGPDGGSDTFLGENIGAKASTTTGCVNGTTFPNFQGTSAATPHVAGVAALLLEADPGLTVDQLYTILQQSTLSMAPASPNIVGAGFLQADIAATKTPAVIPPAPVLTLASTSIAVGASTTLTWTSSNNQGCTASGAWSGAEASNGQSTISPTATGTQTYTLMCTNQAGTSQPDSVTLTVTAAAAASGGGGHGGGSMDVELLLALSGLAVGRALIARRTRMEIRRAS